MHTEVQMESLNRRDYLADLGIIDRILKCTSRKQDGRVATEFIWFRIGTGSGLL
jgi:hypothetical protein